VIASCNLGVRWRRGSVAAALAVVIVCLRWRSGLGRTTRGAVIGNRSRAGGGSELGLLALDLALRDGPLLTVDEDVRHAAALAVLVDDLVLVGRFGVFGDDVPGVDKAGNLRGRRRISAWWLGARAGWLGEEEPT
jgi:hypothetical protein